MCVQSDDSRNAPRVLQNERREVVRLPRRMRDIEDAVAVSRQEAWQGLPRHHEPDVVWRGHHLLEARLGRPQDISHPKRQGLLFFFTFLCFVIGKKYISYGSVTFFYVLVHFTSFNQVIPAEDVRQEAIPSRRPCFVDHAVWHVVLLHYGGPGTSNNRHCDLLRCLISLVGCYTILLYPEIDPGSSKKGLWCSQWWYMWWYNMNICNQKMYAKVKLFHCKQCWQGRKSNT